MTFASDIGSAANLAVATLAGLGVGLEREWSGHTAGPTARFAGIRTFALLGLLGGVAGWLSLHGFVIAAAVLLLAGGALTTAAYWAATMRPLPPIQMPVQSLPNDEPAKDLVEIEAHRVGATTEAAALVVLGLGLMAGLGALQLAAGATAAVVLALAEKTEMHRLVRRIGREELLASLQFAVLALVILPILPEGPYGPLGGIKPRTLWEVVLIFSALNFAGYIARKLIGETRGYALTGMLGGLISSTAVTLTFARRSRAAGEQGWGLALGVIAACTMLIPRVAVVSLVLNAPIVVPLLWYVTLPFVVGVGMIAGLTWWAHRRGALHGETKQDDGNPLRLWSAIQMAIAFQITLMAITFVRSRWGNQGVIPSATILGLTDMDALTLAMNKLGENRQLLRLAAEAIGVGILSNTVLKLGVAASLGTGTFRRVAVAGLAVLGVASTIALVLW